MYEFGWKYFLFSCIYKMHLISAEGYKNAGVDLLKKTGEIWTKKTYKMV